MLPLLWNIFLFSEIKNASSKAELVITAMIVSINKQIQKKMNSINFTNRAIKKGKKSRYVNTSINWSLKPTMGLKKLIGRNFFHAPNNAQKCCSNYQLNDLCRFSKLTSNAFFLSASRFRVSYGNIYFLSDLEYLHTFRHVIWIIIGYWF